MSPEMVGSPLTPQCDYQQEVRLAVVMYGGVSLAIYMNGVTQELWHLVRATAPHPDGGGRFARGPAAAG